MVADTAHDGAVASDAGDGMHEADAEAEELGILVVLVLQLALASATQLRRMGGMC